ncbi:MAG: hypothetical protein GF364_15095 [Candidatus Lokiarchaeota archaeon]|nr:hypothetical protein [Candidatus Lokiarchaeota archaeon]
MQCADLLYIFHAIRVTEKAITFLEQKGITKDFKLGLAVKDLQRFHKFCKTPEDERDMITLFAQEVNPMMLCHLLLRFIFLRDLYADFENTCDENDLFYVEAYRNLLGIHPYSVKQDFAVGKNIAKLYRTYQVEDNGNIKESFEQFKAEIFATEEYQRLKHELHDKQLFLKGLLHVFLRKPVDLGDV